MFIQQKNGSFVKKITPAFKKDKSFTDSDMALFDASADGWTDIYIAGRGYDNFSSVDSSLSDRLYLNDGKNNFTKSKGLPTIYGSKSCVRIQDINADGSPDIFVGGRVIPGRYPESPASNILINDGKGNFLDQTQRICLELS